MPGLSGRSPTGPAAREVEPPSGGLLLASGEQ